MSQTKYPRRLVLCPSYVQYLRALKCMRVLQEVEGRKRKKNKAKVINFWAQQKSAAPEGTNTQDKEK